MAKKAARGHNYCMDEDLNFLLIMDELLPITDEEWSRVVVKHNSLNPDINCVGERNEIDSTSILHAASEACPNR